MQVLVRESSSFFLCSTAHHDEFVVVAKACTGKYSSLEKRQMHICIRFGYTVLLAPSCSPLSALPCCGIQDAYKHQTAKRVN